MANDNVRIENGWSLYGHPFFISRLADLITEVERLAERKPRAFNAHPAYKLLACVRECMIERVPSEPSHADFRQGGTLGQANRHWYRVKKALPARYRMFYQFRSAAPKTIIYAWLNDDRTLRQDGAKTDVYAVFGKMLSSGKIPNKFDELLASSTSVASGS